MKTLHPVVTSVGFSGFTGIILPCCPYMSIIYIYVCVYVHTYVRTYIHTYIISMYIYIYTCVCVSTLCVFDVFVQAALVAGSS